jgi:adenylate cyclase class 2
VVFDETPIGNYLELEGPQRWIDEVARQLGYSRRDYITESYAALYLKKCQVEGKTPGNMIFPARES